MVAKRDGLDEAAARASVEQTLRLSEAARRAAAQRAADPAPLVAPERDAHLRRGALARAWLNDVFEPDYELADMPRSHVPFQQALASARYVHKRLHLACQLVAVPSGEFPDTAALQAAAADPAWQGRAKIRIDKLASRMGRSVSADDPAACEFMGKLVAFETKDDGDVAVRYERAGFDLDACAVPRPADGTCPEPRWATEWTDQVRKADGPGFLPPFASRFGQHLVFVIEILPEAKADDPATDQKIREEVGPAWQQKEFEGLLDRLAEKRAVRSVLASEPAAP